jgi:hypothetical protein
VNKGHSMKAKKRLSHNRKFLGERSTDRRHCGEPSYMAVSSPRRSRNPNHSFTEGLCVSVRRIAD